MAYVGGAQLENFSDDFIVFNLPYIFDSQDHQRAVINDPEIIGELYTSLEEQNIRVLAGFHGGVRNVYNSVQPVNTPEDMAGMKIRVQESDTHIEMLNLMGGSATPMAQGEVYTAIQTGVLEGGENNELVYVDLKQLEVAEYYSYTRHLMVPDYLIINPTVYEGFGENQEAFDEAIAWAVEREAELWVEKVEEAIATAEEAGAQFNEADTDAFAEILVPFSEESVPDSEAGAAAVREHPRGGRGLLKQSPMQQLESVKRILDRSLTILCVALFGILVIVVTWQVFARQILQEPSQWSETLSRYLFVWVGLLGAALVFGERGHIAIDFGVRRLPRALQKWTGILVQFIIIPFFVLAGVIMNSGGIATRLIDAAKVMVGRVPGSLAQANVMANAMFGAVSGSAVAAAAAVGSTMAPMQKREGYDPRFSAAANIASAPAGMLIPPSNVLIVYSLVSGSSVAALFMAGYVPGILWAIGCMIVVHFYARKRPELKTNERLPFLVALKVLLKAVPALLMIVIVIGGILTGWFTPTEAAVIAVLYSLVLGFIYREIKVSALFGIFAEATKTTAIVVFLIGVSTAMSWLMSYTQVPGIISDLITSVTESPVIIMLLIAIVLLVVGTFMDATPAVLIFTPIFLPILVEAGMDPVHFGIFITFAVCVGVITPPVGTVLFVGSKIGRVRMESVLKYLVPFFIAVVAVLFLVLYVPSLTLALPQWLGAM